jgi:hypothetical protein
MNTNNTNNNSNETVVSIKEDPIMAWWRYFDESTDEEAHQNYLNCKHQFEYEQDSWTLDEMECFSQYMEKYENEHNISPSLSMPDRTSEQGI